MYVYLLLSMDFSAIFNEVIYPASIDFQNSLKKMITYIYISNSLLYTCVNVCIMIGT